MLLIYRLLTLMAAAVSLIPLATKNKYRSRRLSDPI
jgi:hypothetical protein